MIVYLCLLDASTRNPLIFLIPQVNVCLCSSNSGEALATCREQLGQGPVEAPMPLDWQTACQGRGDDHPERCPVCGRLLMRRGVIPRGERPPPAEPPAQVAA